MADDREPGEWFRLIFRTRKVERAEGVLGALRKADIPIILEETDEVGKVHVLPAGEPLVPGGVWSVFVPEARFRLALGPLRKLPFRITTDPDGKPSRHAEDRQGGQVVLWFTVLMASCTALIFAVQVWRGVITVTWEEVCWTLLGLFGVLAAIVFPIWLAIRDARHWVRANRRRFVPRAAPARQDGPGGRET